MPAHSDLSEQDSIAAADITRTARRQFEVSLIVGLVMITIAGMMAATSNRVQHSAAPAWKTIPSWYLMCTDDHMIPPPAQEFMADGEANSVIPATDGRSSAAKFSGKRTHHRVADAGHALPQQAPKVSADAVIEVTKSA
jgi:pimeloyl-ACP methyl ester carboxylesterase